MNPHARTSSFRRSASVAKEGGFQGPDEQRAAPTPAAAALRFRRKPCQMDPETGGSREELRAHVSMAFGARPQALSDNWSG